MQRRLTAFLIALMMLWTMFPARAEEAVPPEVPPVVSEEPTAEPTAEVSEEATAEPTAEVTEGPTAEPTAEVSEEPTAEPTAEVTEEPTAKPTAEVTEEPTAEPTAEVTEGPTAEPTAEVTEEPTATPAPFMAGLAVLSGGAWIYEQSGRWDVLVETAASGVVFAHERTEDEAAIRITLFDGDALVRGWVGAETVRMMTADESAVHDAADYTGIDVETVQGHPLTAVRVVWLAATATPAPTESPAVTDEPIVTDEPVVTDKPVVTDEPIVTDKPSITESPAIPDEPAHTETPTPSPEPAPEPTIVVIPRDFDAPTGLAASHNASGTMTLTWDEVPGADGYQVLYKAAWESEYRLLDLVSGTRCSTSRLDRTVVYYFRVQAVQLDETGGVISTGKQSGSLPYICLGDAKLGDPRGKDTSTVHLTWSAVGGANRYDVLMRVHGSGSWQQVKTGLSVTECDVGGLSYNETYDFKVVPKRTLYSGQALSGNPSRVAMVGSPMETPSFTSYEWTEAGLRLNWNAIPGANGYVIYRRAFSEPDVTNYTKLVVLDEPVTTYVDTQMDPGEVYYYFVYSFKNCVPEGWRCFSLKGKIGMGIWMEKPTGLNAASTADSGTRLAWNWLTGANYYDVHITSTAGTYPTGGGNGRVEGNTGYHATAAIGKTYYYRVRGVRLFSNGDVSYSPWSDAITYTREQAAPVYRALLIGNTYSGEADELPGCGNDVSAMASMLRRMTATPYQISTQRNVTANGMVRAISSAFGDATANDVSLFYFSGHGVNSPATGYHGALVGTGSSYLTAASLRSALDTIPGKKVVIVDSCYSGALLGAQSRGAGSSSPSDFNSAFISAFTGGISTIDKQAEAPLTDEQEIFVQEPLHIQPRGENDLSSGGYYVITASHAQEESVSTGYDEDSDGVIDKYFGLFTYGLCHGNGWNEATDSVIGALHADKDGNGQITLYEAYAYAKNHAQRMNPYQTAQIYPANSGLVIWAK